MKCSLYSLYVLKNLRQGPIWLAIYGNINVERQELAMPSEHEKKTGLNLEDSHGLVKD